MKPQTFWQRVGRSVRDSYFVIGSVLVALLVLAAVLGPELAPHNPFLVKPIQWIDGELHKAPFPPGDPYPLGTDDLGRDQLSLLLYGARTTLFMAFAATIMRMLVGLLLGTMAGWWPGKPIDQAVTALAEFLAAIPGLIMAMLLVFAVGLRQGPLAFIVALSVVGCGEVAQIVRGHVLTIRNEAFIEAARAVGLSEPGILSRHVLPNLLATLLALAALEMGAVLLLLGELGFVHIFIGGGRTGLSFETFEVQHYFDVPDWGAMLGSSWRWFRSYPWFPIVPAAAFFVAVLGFNLFGYGLQRFIERGRFHPSGWSVLRFLLVTALILLGARSFLRGASIEAQYAKTVRQFDVSRAWDDIVYLTQPELGGRPADSEGGALAAEYIASQFDQAGLSPVTPQGSYFQSHTGIRGRVTAEPVLEVLDGSGAPQLRITDGISFDPWQAFNAEGSADGELFVLGNTSREATYAGGILLMPDPEDPLRPHIYRRERPYAGVLRVVPDDELASNEQAPPIDDSLYLRPERVPSYPNLLIAESAARQVLAQADVDLEEVRAAMAQGERLELQTGLQVRLTYGLVYEEVPGTSVFGYIAGMGMESRGERVLLVATYAGTPPREGVVYPGADENASGVAVLLETARLLQELEFVPRRTIVFGAFDSGGEGHFLNQPALPTSRSDVWTVVIVQGVGAGEPKLARLEAGAGLGRAFDESARRFGVRTEGLDAWPFFFVSNRSRMRWGDPEALRSYQGLVVTRPGDDLSGTPGDTLDHLDQDLLAEVGMTVAHYVMVLSNR